MFYIFHSHSNPDKEYIMLVYDPFGLERRSPRHREPAMPMDVVKGEGGLALHLDVPGVTESELSVSVVGRTLTITAEREAPSGELVSQHRVMGQMVRRLRLPEEADGTAITAALDRGVLVINVPFKTTEGHRQIPITAAGNAPDKDSLAA
jgi:HSP20 family protein